MTSPRRSPVRSAATRGLVAGVAALLCTAATPAVSAFADVPVDPTTGVVRTVGPADSLLTALKASAPGDTVLLLNGTYPLQKLAFSSFPGVTLKGESRDGVVVKGFTFKTVSGLNVQTMTISNEVTSGQSAIRVSDGSSQLAFSDVTIAPTIYSGLDIWAGTSAISLTGSTVVGTGVTGVNATNSTSRGVRINGAPYALENWPTDISLVGNDISGFGSDLIQVVGGQRVLVKNNFLHDPQLTADHNDGVQAVGSTDLRIEGNRFSAPGANGPDNAVMLGQPGTVASLKVTGTTVVNNVVLAWRGTGINLAGTDTTTIVNNTVPMLGTATSQGSSVGLHGTNGNVRIFNNVLDKIYYEGSQPTTQWNNCVRYGGLGTGLITTSPKYASTATLKLLSTSPCLADGDPNGAPATDISGALRPATPDRGAWQY